MKPNIIMNEEWKIFRSDELNYNFNMKTGYTETWGVTKDEDPIFSPYGALILDIEVSTICTMGCKFCYKSNTVNGKNMTFETFKQIIDSFPKYNNLHLLTQCAIGIGNVDANPNLWKMMKYCRENYIIPNITINGDRLTDEIIDKLVTLCGAISVSVYDDKNIAYDAVYSLQKAGMKQVNLHCMISQESEGRCLDVIDDIVNDHRLENLNAVVFLSLKQKGRGTSYNPISNEGFKRVIESAVKHNIPFGCDSCGANKLTEVAKQIGTFDKWSNYIEPCESCSFSSYIDTDGVFFPCSFASECTKGIDVTKTLDFKTEVWDNISTIIERNRINSNNRSCPYFNV